MLYFLIQFTLILLLSDYTKRTPRSCTLFSVPSAITQRSINSTLGAIWLRSYKNEILAFVVDLTSHILTGYLTFHCTVIALVRQMSMGKWIWHGLAPWRLLWKDGYPCTTLVGKYCVLWVGLTDHSKALRGVLRNLVPLTSGEWDY